MKNKFLGLLLILSGLFSCTIYKEYPIDIYKPGVVSLPEEAESVAIVSRNFKYSIDTLQNYYSENGELVKDWKSRFINIDSLAITEALQGLLSELMNSGRFSNVEIWPYNTITPYSGDKLAPYNQEAVKKLTEPTNSSLLISLESLSYFFSEDEMPGEPTFKEVKTAAIWAVYDPLQNKLIENKQLIDTVYWDGYDENQEIRVYNQPERIEAIKTACELAGKNYSKRLIPSWQKVYRMYLTPPIEDFRIASAYFEDGKWDKAIQNWAIYTPAKYRKLAIDARYNIALAYEMKDELEKALTWIRQAEKLAISLKSKSELKMVLLYKKVLTQRLEELLILNDSE